MSITLSCPFIQFEDLYDRLSKEELVEFLNENFEAKNQKQQIMKVGQYITFDLDSWSNGLHEVIEATSKIVDLCMIQ